MKPTDVRIGAKFVDPKLTSNPPQYRLHIVRSVADGKFTAEHVASGSVRTFSTEPDTLAQLQLVNPLGCFVDLDALVGERVRLDLTDGGSLGGRVTAVVYYTVEVAGVSGLAVAREVKAIELDRSGGSTYPMREIARVTVL